ncbi:MAG: bestrophin family protein [Minicystis sp.]
MHGYDPRSFWPYVWSIRGAVTLRVLPRVLIFTAIAALVTIASELRPGLGSAVGPAEAVGVALGLLLVVRTNAGHGRWWEARKLWGGIVNQSRNLAIDVVAYGPPDPAFRERVVRWCAVFPHVARHSLRGERELPEVAALVGAEEAAAVARAQHMPSYVALRIAALLRASVEHGMDRFAFLAADRERAQLIDHLGACERILKTPLPLVYVIKIRRFVALYLVGLPFALVGSVGWVTPFITLMVSYALLGIDQIAVELENPFSTANLSHLPLDDISCAIEANLLGLAALAREPAPPAGDGDLAAGDGQRDSVTRPVGEARDRVANAPRDVRRVGS